MLPWGEEQGALLTLPFVNCKDAWWENAGRSQQTLGSYATTISLYALHHAPAHSGLDVTSGTGRHWATTCTGQQGATSTDDSRTKTGIRLTISINRAFYCYSLMTNPIFWILMPVSANQSKWKLAILAWRKLVCKNLFFSYFGKRERVHTIVLREVLIIIPWTGPSQPGRLYFLVTTVLALIGCM